MPDQTIIKPNQKFRAYEQEIPTAFRDIIICTQPEQLEEQGEPAQEEVKQPGYTVVPDDTPGWYNIVDGQGKKVNESKLRKEQADEMLEDLKQ